MHVAFIQSETPITKRSEENKQRKRIKTVTTDHKKEKEKEKQIKIKVTGIRVATELEVGN